MDQELILKASFLEQHAKESEQNLEMVRQQIAQLTEFLEHISSLADSSDKEMLASLGKGVYVKSSLAEKKLFVEVGAGVIVRKTPEETKKVIESQITRLNEVRVQLSSQVDFYTHNLQELIHEIESQTRRNG
ncbi:prefoldin subunit alpha [Candidatus Pacearchaeota archaeon]|nr:prefoldin subunit alpha [Candidatus Pacearchaeota archaeon]